MPAIHLQGLFSWAGETQRRPAALSRTPFFFWLEHINLRNDIFEIAFFF